MRFKDLWGGDSKRKKEENHPDLEAELKAYENATTRSNVIRRRGRVLVSRSEERRWLAANTDASAAMRDVARALNVSVEDVIRSGVLMESHLRGMDRAADEQRMRELVLPKLRLASAKKRRLK